LTSELTTKNIWKNIRLGELVTIKHGYAFKSEFFSEDFIDNPIVVNIVNFKYDGGFRFDSTLKKGYVGTYPQEFDLKPNDILLIMTCQTAGGEILGIPGKIPNDGRSYLHNQRMGKVEIEKLDMLDHNFIYWVFVWNKFNQELCRTATGTKILHTAPERIENFSFNLPPMKEQIKIANTLDQLQNKIQNLQNQNRILEQMAQTTFKTWFVDFDGVTEWDDSELGKIPKGWKITKLGSFTEIKNGFAFKSDTYVKEGIFLLRTTNFSKTEYVNKEDVIYLPLAFYEKFKNFQLEKFDILLVMVGASTGSVGFVTSNILPALQNQNMWNFRAKKQGHQLFLHHLVKKIVNANMGTVNGSARDFFRKDYFRTIKFIEPSEKIIYNFNQLMIPIYEKLSMHITQIQTLTKTRDALLPKLMSGEIRV
jgi:type I restriction enzyme, S subunit